MQTGRMAQPNLHALAKQGNPRAIAALMNHSLQSRQITVKAGLKNDCLTIFASATQVPDRAFMVNFVRQGMQRLSPKLVNRAIVQGHAIGQSQPAWRAVVNLAPQESAESPFGSPPPLYYANRHSGKTARSKRQRPSRPLPKSARRLLSAVKLAIGTWLYLFIAFLGVAVASGIKIFTVWLAENSLYKVDVLGEILRGLEAIELINLLVFAILGAAFGLATAVVPKKLFVRTSIVLLIIVIPFVFSISSFLRYDIWLQQFAEVENISYQKAEMLTDNYLERRVGHPGFWGFYLYTAESPALPTHQADMETIEELEGNVTAKMATVIGISSDRIALAFRICSWGIRLFYFFLSAIAAAIHFTQGVKVGDRLSRRGEEIAE